MSILANNNYVLLLKNPNYLKYIIGQTISVIGNIFYKIAIVFLILQETNSPKTLGFVLAISYAPQFIFGLVAGSLVDRFDRKKIMIYSDLIRGLVLIAFIVLLQLGMFSIPAVFILTFILSSASMFFSPSAQAFIPEIVEKDLIVSCSAFKSTINEICEIVGVSVGGILIYFFGCTVLVLFDGISFFISALSIGLIVVNKTKEKAQKSNTKLATKKDEINVKGILSDIKVGINYVVHDGFIRSFLLLLVICNISYGVVYTLPAVFSEQVLHAGSKGYGYMQSGLSIGMLVGLNIIGIAKLKKVGHVFLLGLACSGIAVLLFGMNDKLLVAILIYGLFGVFDAFTVPMFSYLQVYVDDSMKGRVFSVFDVAVLSTVPIATAVSGYVSEEFGVAIIYKLCGILLILAAILGYFLKELKTANLDSEDDESDLGQNITAATEAVAEAEAVS